MAKPNQYKATIRKNGSTNEFAAEGQRWDLRGLDRHQYNAVRERIVDFWCISNGWKQLYGTFPTHP